MSGALLCGEAVDLYRDYESVRICFHPDETAVGCPAEAFDEILEGVELLHLF